ncbi:hypothetical protein OsI_23099 [Oryza sativa Indica Group]|uniref:Uncharacterized protein n=1 Tax=Oryza sativa subsp. indica TaxID=39946 RepID=B8B2U9_ORYSI|nr:hypothetical protein OsI_23099 [Oryza sativa Indica Group]
MHMIGLSKGIRMITVRKARIRHHHACMQGWSPMGRDGLPKNRPKILNNLLLPYLHHIGTSPNPNRGSPLQVSGPKLQLYNAQQIGGFEKSLMFPEPEPDASPSWLAARCPTPEGAPMPSGPNAGWYRLQIQSSTKGVLEYGVGRLLAASAL